MQQPHHPKICFTPSLLAFHLETTPTTLVPTKWNTAYLITGEEISKDTRLPTLSILRHLTRSIWPIHINDDGIQVESLCIPSEGIYEDRKIELWVEKCPKGRLGKAAFEETWRSIEIQTSGPLQTSLCGRHLGEWDEIIMVCVKGQDANWDQPDLTPVGFRRNRHNTFLSAHPRRTASLLGQELLVTLT